MPIIELIFPSFKQDSESIALLEEQAPNAFQAFTGVPGLYAGFRAQIVKEDKSPVVPNIAKFILILGWEDVSFFHDFFPQSEKFQGFMKIIKPLVTAPATPELYEAADQVSACASSNFVQIFKVRHTKETESAWKKLVSAVKNFSGEEIPNHAAVGTEKEEGNFIGLIGWKSLEAHDEAEKDSTIGERIDELVQGWPVKSLVVQTSPM